MVWSPVSKHQIQPVAVWRMSRLTWDRTAEPKLTRDTKLSGANGNNRREIIFSLFN